VSGALVCSACHGLAPTTRALWITHPGTHREAIVDVALLMLDKALMVRSLSRRDARHQLSAIAADVPLLETLAYLRLWLGTSKTGRIG